MYGLYAITDSRMTPYDTIGFYIQSAIEGGTKIIQLRDKTLSDEALRPIALQVKTLCEQNNVLFVIDDRMELAASIGAAGLHIGQNDIGIKEAAKLFKGVIGVSCYGNLDLALEAQGAGADYVAFGAFYPSKTKPHTKTVSLDLLREAKKHLAIPVCAIGGITEETIGGVVNAGADSVAIISEIWEAKDITQKCRRLVKAFA